MIYCSDPQIADTFILPCKVIVLEVIDKASKEQVESFGYSASYRNQMFVHVEFFEGPLADTSLWVPRGRLACKALSNA